MKIILVIAFLGIALMASSGRKKDTPSWLEVRAQQQADSTVYEAVLTLDSMYRTKRK